MHVCIPAPIHGRCPQPMINVEAASSSALISDDQDLDGFEVRPGGWKEVDAVNKVIMLMAWACLILPQSMIMGTPH